MPITGVIPPFFMRLPGVSCGVVSCRAAATMVCMTAERLLNDCYGTGRTTANHTNK
mgnify:CR=1 FL=1